MSDLDRLEKELIDQAMQVKSRAYAPYSHFQVGAALLTGNGTIVVGCNVENCSYGLTICAERTAAVAAVTRGLFDWKAIAIATAGGISPCGACRQFLAEFAPNLTILLVDTTGTNPVVKVSLSELLPSSFHPSCLPKGR
jgi:cytidine deaminase